MIKIPVKQDLNLAQKDRRKLQLGAVLPTALILAVLIGLFCKFGVIDQLQKLDQAQARTTQIQQRLSEIQKQTADYDQKMEEYQSYQLSQEMLSGGPDLLECLSLIQTQLLDWAQLSSFTVSDNLISVELSGVTLQQVSGIYADLMSSELVSGVQVYTAATTESQNERVEASMTIRLVTQTNPGEEAVS